MNRSTQRGLIVLGVFLTCIAVAWAANFPTTLTYNFKNGFEVSNGTVTLPTGAITVDEVAALTVGAAPAATCTAGALHVDTDETDDTNCTTTADNALCMCIAADTWASNEP